MFERYTEKARRVIFFARYEASHYGSPYIETEHLLLGFLREDHAVARRVLASGSTIRKFISSEASIESIRRKISDRGMLGQKFPTSVDLPLSNESKRVLAYAAEEAERLAHRHIGTEHLLLGLLREKKSFAAQLLNEEGITLEQARENFSGWLKTIERGEHQETQEIIEIHGEAWNLKNIQDRAKEFRKFAWRKREWKPLDVLVESATGKVCFEISPPHESSFQLVAAGWPREKCLICRWELNADGGDEHSLGYTNGRGWVCAECHDQFLANKSQAAS
jgi:ATP-dependent Clp protease ATP-binding subunit ClpA